MSANSEPTSPTQKSCPGLPGKGCGKFLASWDDHPLCTSCRRTAPEPCLGIFACPTCVDWSEEQRLRFNNRRTYRKKVPSSPPSDLGDLLVVDCATDSVPTEPVTLPPPSQPTDSTPTVPAQHTLESLLVGLSTQLSSLTASLRGEKGGGTGPRPASPLPDRPPMAASNRSSPSDDEHLPPFPGCFPDFGDRSRSPSETDPLQPHQPRYRTFSRSPLAYSRSRSRSRSPARHPWAEPRGTDHGNLDPLRPGHGYYRPRAPSQGRRRHPSPRLPDYSHAPATWRVQHHNDCRRSPSRDFPYRSSRSRSRSRDRYRHYSRRSHDTSHTEPCRPSRGHAETRQHGSTHVTSRRRSPGRARPHRSSSSRTPRRSLRSRSRSLPSRSSSRSKERRHLSSSRDSPSRRSRSRSRLRSRSPTVDHDDYPSYPEKVAQVRLLFADSPAMLAHPPNPAPARDVNLASRQSTTPPRPRDLPWNPSTAQIRDHYMDQLTGRDPKAKSSTGLGPATFLRRPRFRERVYRVSGHPKAAYAAQVPAKFRVLQPPEKATAHSRPFITDFDMSDMEVQLRRSNIILSYQDWFLGSVLRLSEQLQSTTAEHTPTQKILHDLQEFVFSASRAGYDARQHVCHLLFNTVLRRRDAYLSDTFPRLQAPLRKQLRAHILDDSLLFSESTCETALETFTQASNVTLLSQATRASRDSSRSSRPNPRDRQQQQQPQRQPHRPTAASRQRQPFRGKNRSLPQSSTKKGGGSGKDKH